MKLKVVKVKKYRIQFLVVLIFCCKYQIVAGLDPNGISEAIEDKEEELTDFGDFLGEIPQNSDSNNRLKSEKGCGKLPKEKPPLTLMEYKAIRDKALNQEDKFQLGGSLTLNARERKVNRILMNYKNKEFEQGLVTSGLRIPFPAGMHFYHIKKFINHSNVYKIIKLMPKGGVLHLHDLQSGSMEFAVQLTKIMPNLYMCWDATHVLRFEFFTTPTVASYCVTEWILVEQFRRNASSSEFVDDIFLRKMRLFTDTPEVDYPDNNAAWRIFINTIITTGGLLGYENATKLYFYNLLQQFYDDNCQYIEVRSLLEFFYRLDAENPALSEAEVLQLFKDVTDKFVAEHPDFWGARIIYSPRRVIPEAAMAEKLAIAVELKKMFPEFLAGFDMAYHEDMAFPLDYYKAPLLKASAQGLKFFFHAGETDWHGTRIDDNLLDAVLLNATRIGHGTALNARPYLVERIKEKGIGLEVNPISSQVLKLSSADMRTHPTIPFIRDGFPMVISCDDAGSLGTNNLSYDLYMAFMAMAGQRADLRFLKQLVINSIKYSAMCDSEKSRNMRRLRKKWNIFLKEVLIQFPTS